MIRTARESRPATVQRARPLRRLAVAALAASGISYGLHHTTPLDGHGLGVVLLVVAVAAVAAVLVAALARTGERELPVFVTLRPGNSAIRTLDPDDLGFCAALHAETLPHGFFAQLGYRFLRAYLATFIASPHAVALLVTADDVPVGTVVGILRPHAHTRWVLRHRGVRLALLGGVALAARPRLALRFARTRIGRYRRAWSRRQTSAAAEPAGQPAVLSHVAVVPGAQGAGLGRQLVDAFVEAARAAASPGVVLTTLAGDDGAAGFYRRQGWVESGPLQNFDGRSTILFSLPLRPEER
ncbi:MAG: GNAT family N-acetyltransferase [Gaiellaceae bacterium]